MPKSTFHAPLAQAVVSLAPGGVLKREQALLIQCTERERVAIAHMLDGTPAHAAGKLAGFPNASEFVEGLRAPNSRAGRALRQLVTRALMTDGAALAWGTLQGLMADPLVDPRVRSTIALRVLELTGQKERAAEAQRRDRQVSEMTPEELARALDMARAEVERLAVTVPYEHVSGGVTMAEYFGLNKS